MNNKIAVVTGASSGIGKALTVNLAEQKIPVLAVSRNAEKLATTKAEQPDLITSLVADVGIVDGRQKLIAAIPEDTDVAYLIHAAGQIKPIAAIDKINEEEWLRHFNINFHTPVFLTKNLLPKLKNGRILHLSSAAAHQASYALGAYCCSKAALYMLYKLLQLELVELPVFVGSVMPGIIDTPMQEIIRNHDKEDFPDKKFYEQLKKQNRLTPTDTCARFLTWLLLSTSNDEFTKQEWDIYDESHHPHWLAGLNLPLPNIDE